MYYTGSNSSSSQMMQFPAGQQGQQISGLSTYASQPFIVQPQPNVYAQQGSNIVPMSITPQSNQNLVGIANSTPYHETYGQSIAPSLPTQQRQQLPTQAQIAPSQQLPAQQTQPTPQVQGYSYSKPQPSGIPPDDDRYRKQLIVNYLAPDVTSSDLHALFSRFGPLDGARIIYDRQTFMPRGYGFVYFHYPESAKEAVERMNGYDFHGKRLKVSYSTNPLNIISSTLSAPYRQDAVRQ